MPNHWKSQHPDLPNEKHGYVKKGKQPRTRQAMFKNTIKMLSTSEMLGLAVEYDESTPGQQRIEQSDQLMENFAKVEEAAAAQQPEVPWPADNGRRQTRSRARSQSRGGDEEKIMNPEVPPM